MKEFEIEGYNNKFRFKDATDPIMIMAYGELLAKEDLKTKQEIYSFAIDNTEVMVGDMWSPVRKKFVDNAGNEHFTYMPTELAKDIKAIQYIVYKFINDVIADAFQSSSE